MHTSTANEVTQPLPVDGQGGRHSWPYTSVMRPYIDLLQDGYPHTTALTIVIDSWENVVIRVIAARTDESLAWDAADAYLDASVPPNASKDIAELPWHDRGDIASRLLLDTNSYWLGRLAGMLWPSYSIDRLAAQTLCNHIGSKGRLRVRTTLAYFPCDTSVMLAHSRECEDAERALESILAEAETSDSSSY